MIIAIFYTLNWRCVSGYLTDGEILEWVGVHEDGGSGG